MGSNSVEPTSEKRVWDTRDEGRRKPALVSGKAVIERDRSIVEVPPGRLAGMDDVSLRWTGPHSASWRSGGFAGQARFDPQQFLWRIDGRTPGGEALVDVFDGTENDRDVVKARVRDLVVQHEGT